MSAVAFLDRLGRFAKRDEDVAEVRIFHNGDADILYTLTRAEFNALTPSQRLEINNAGSAAGLIVTEGISNA